MTSAEPMDNLLAHARMSVCQHCFSPIASLEEGAWTHVTNNNEECLPPASPTETERGNPPDATE